MKNLLILVIFILLAQSAGLIGSIFTQDSIEVWYEDLTKPSFNPPSQAFGPVWTALYTLMGIASYRIYKLGNLELLCLYSAHLVINTLWSIIFFGMRSIAGGLAVIVILDLLVILMTQKFYKTDRLAGLSLIPYLFWLLFATALNFAILWLN